MSVWATLTGPFAEINVGEGSSAVVFSLPKKLLCNSSTYFDAALNNGFAETATQKITLDDDPEVFRTYAAWLFEHEIIIENIDVNDYERHLFHVYIFADKRGIVGLANDVITMLASYWTTESVDMAITVDCLPSILPGRTLYRLTLDSLIINIRSDWWDEDSWEELSRHSKKIIMELFRRDRVLPDDFDSHRCCFEAICHYHEHNSDEEKNECIRKLEGGRNIYTWHEVPYKQIEWRW